jgi:hypothetical protein
MSQEMSWGLGSIQGLIKTGTMVFFRGSTDSRLKKEFLLGWLRNVSGFFFVNHRKSTGGV